MKKIVIAMSCLFFTLLSGCSFLEDTNDTLNYVNEANSYIEQVSSFAESAPGLVQEAVTDQQAVQDLQQEIQSMQESIASFSDLEAPGLVADLHQQLVEQNEQLSEGINGLQNQLENGTLTPEFLENSEVLQSVQQIQNIFNQIEQLGGEG